MTNSLHEQCYGILMNGLLFLMSASRYWLSCVFWFSPHCHLMDWLIGSGVVLLVLDVSWSLPQVHKALFTCSYLVVSKCGLSRMWHDILDKHLLKHSWRVLKIFPCLFWKYLSWCILALNFVFFPAVLQWWLLLGTSCLVISLLLGIHNALPLHFSPFSC